MPPGRGEGDTGAEGGHEGGVRVHSVRRTPRFWLMDRQEVAGERGETASRYPNAKPINHDSRPYDSDRRAEMDTYMVPFISKEAGLRGLETHEGGKTKTEEALSWAQTSMCTPT